MSNLSLSKPPWYFQIATKLLGSEIRGAYRYLKLLDRLGLLNRSATFELPDGSALAAPLNWPGIAHTDVFKTYEPDAIQKVAKALRAAEAPISFIDCGADIGTYTRLLLTHTENIDSFIAIEPNRSAALFLEMNLSNYALKHRIISGAVSNFSGYGKLVAPDGEASSHAYFLEPSPEETDLEVYRIDQLDLGTPGTVAMKIDVEGEEFNVLQGATETLQGAKQFVLQIEAHPEVCNRVGLEPTELIRFLTSIKPCETWACIEKTREVFEVKDVNTPFFEQFDKGHIHDLIIISQDH